ncbi:MAG: TolB family protein [Bacteroidota bacterium]
MKKNSSLLLYIQKIGYILFLVIFCTSCIDDMNLGFNDTDEKQKIIVSEYDIENKEKKELLRFTNPSQKPFVRYFNHANKKVIAHNNTFYFIDYKGIIEEVQLDSLTIDNDSYFDISPDNRELLFAAPVPSALNSTSITKKKGLYVYDLKDNTLSLLVAETDKNILFPSYSHSGSHIVYTQKENAISQLVIMNIQTKKKTVISAQDSETIEYGMFAENNNTVVYYASPHSLYEYDRATETKRLLIENKKISHSDIRSEYPVFNISRNCVFYSALSEDSLAHELYKFDCTNNRHQKLLYGKKPMSVEDNNIVYIKKLCTHNCKDKIMFYNETENIEISEGSYAIMSKNRKYILFISQ